MTSQTFPDIIVKDILSLLTIHVARGLGGFKHFQNLHRNLSIVCKQWYNIFKKIDFTYHLAITNSNYFENLKFYFKSSFKKTISYSLCNFTIKDCTLFTQLFRESIDNVNTFNLNYCSSDKQFSDLLRDNISQTVLNKSENPKFPKLKTVTINSEYSDIDSLAELLKEQTTIENFYYISKIPVDNLPSILQLSNLKSLNLSNCKLTSKLLQELTDNPDCRLTYLSIFDVTPLGENRENMDNWFKSLSSNKYLTAFELTFSHDSPNFSVTYDALVDFINGNSVLKKLVYNGYILEIPDESYIAKNQKPITNSTLEEIFMAPNTLITNISYDQLVFHDFYNFTFIILGKWVGKSSIEKIVMLVIDSNIVDKIESGIFPKVSFLRLGYDTKPSQAELLAKLIKLNIPTLTRLEVKKNRDLFDVLSGDIFTNLNLNRSLKQLHISYIAQKDLIVFLNMNHPTISVFEVMEVGQWDSTDGYLQALSTNTTLTSLKFTVYQLKNTFVLDLVISTIKSNSNLIHLMLSGSINMFAPSLDQNYRLQEFSELIYENAHRLLTVRIQNGYTQHLNILNKYLIRAY
ncbi:hypothetical protein DLAC_10393 [Tieghemostelium lacteum]|uniref:Uncharacterized protein n=1 Tax=Tieghemostelium lacteum TaxID=361077 RepID=A0A151Z5A8_TIELA|nr:hypothetical protein DLAC_10393 [Tieghemostelium lacteum]|eukprot:KYQ89152.1 hypothetical protein DLAC_10393 [Tieghemostelium lacteum]